MHHDAILEPITTRAQFLAHVPRMEGFHRRYMVSGKVLRWWADMVEPLPIRMIVPQHGAPLAGPAIRDFIAWTRSLACGIDLMGPDNYRIPA